jgi:DNA uptake protein ComE-like DNA-binding protein
VVDALIAVGGPLDNADLERVNLAQKLNDGDQVQVPTRKPGEEEQAAAIRVIVDRHARRADRVCHRQVAPTGHDREFAPGSRAQDAIVAAGGPTENADLARVNLSQLLNDGDQVHVPP